MFSVNRSTVSLVPVSSGRLKLLIRPFQAFLLLIIFVAVGGCGRVVPTAASIPPASTPSQFVIEPTIIEPGQNAGQPRISTSRSTSYGNLPLAFEPNVGQFAAGLDYGARGPGYGVALGRNG